MNHTLENTSFESLKACIKRFGDYLNKSNLVSKDVTFNQEETQKFLSKFLEIRKQELQLDPDLNIFELCSVGRDEVRICAILAWFLDENANHGLGHLFLQKLLFSICEPGQMPTFKDALETGYATRTEICPNADNSDRVDIVCESTSILIYIEVKIDSTEHTAQTDRYYKRLQANAGGRKTILFFISAGDTPSNVNAKNISWKEIGEIANALADMTPSNFIGLLLKHFYRYVSAF